ncbi:hypothetical protein IFT35_14690 [Pantoea agglomerans]|jgi:hypothetical protein|uniref:hypothetical protein n=1 Tax=Enterobacter agglomerans TaxID=549 RepID=UPI00177BF6FD|nr:hypothetical protein [Pantoea agglomerans]MBD8198164.1 hypothetical protein [Pantoea agglomerans]
MATQFEKLKSELAELDKMGYQLYISMHKECDKIDDDVIASLEEKGFEFVSFSLEYQDWYTKSYRVVSQVIKERLSEFEYLYKGDPKRKEVTFMNYSISDYLLGLQQTNGRGEVTRSRKDAIGKMEMQYKILASARERFKSVLFDIKDIVQADIFDSELDTSKELNKKGFVRAAGAVTGVILEKHLSHICSLHGIKPKKAHPSISEYNQALKDSEIIDTPMWRFIQHLGDIRNLCDHSKDREPNKDEVNDFITGVDKVTKTVF